MSPILENNMVLYVSESKTDKKKVTFKDAESIENPLIDSESNINILESKVHNSEAESNRLILVIVIFGCIAAIIILLILYNFGLLKN